MEDKKVILSKFKDDKAGCTEARQYLISLGEWSSDIERRDGWEIVSTANKYIDKHNQEWKPYDDI